MREASAVHDRSFTASGRAARIRASGSGARSRSRGSGRGSGSGRSGGLGRHAFRDHAFTTAGTAGAAADDLTATAAAAPAVGDFAAAAAAIAGDFATAAAAVARGDFTAAAAAVGSRGSRTVALGVLGVQASQKTTVATVMAGTAVAAVAGNRTRVTADEGDGHEGEKHRNRESEKTLHFIPPKKGNQRVTRSRSRHETTPIRDGHRTAADESHPVPGRTPSGNRQHSPGSADGWRKIATWGIWAIRLTGGALLSSRRAVARVGPENGRPRLPGERYSSGVHAEREGVAGGDSRFVTSSWGLCRWPCGSPPAPWQPPAGPASVIPRRPCPAWPACPRDPRS